MRLTVRVRPGAARTRVGGRYGEGDGAALVVAVSARAVDGAATAAVLAAVAQAFEVRTRAVTLVTGATSRTKVLDVDIDDFSTPLALVSRRLRFVDPVDSQEREFVSRRQLPWPANPDERP